MEKLNYSLAATFSPEKIFEVLKSDFGGLSEERAREVLEKMGFNEIKEPKSTSLEIFLKHLKSPFSYLLLIAAFLAFIIGEKRDSFLIFLFTAINVFFGFFQERKAEKAVELLKKYLPSTCKVKRDGKLKNIEKRFLVPGDVVFLEAGDIVPADLRLLKCEGLLVDESILTGESAPVPKIVDTLKENPKEIFQAKNILFGGSSIVSGECEGIVISTGEDTVFGKIAAKTKKEQKLSLFESEISFFSKRILEMTIVTFLALLLFHLLLKGTINFFGYLIFFIALLISLVPEPLPIVVTFALSQAALALAKKKVICKRLSAIEDLGNVEILCSDKTGTLTENKLKLEKVFSENKEKCLLFAILASEYLERKNTQLNPFDKAILKFKTSQKLIQKTREFHLVSEIPFDSERMINTVLVKDGNSNLILISRGAPERILEISKNFEGNLNRENIENFFRNEGREGKRVLAIAYKTLKDENFSKVEGLTFLGCLSFFDPIKPTAKEAVRLAKKLGVRIKILTGDQKETAFKVGKELGLIEKEEEVLEGKELKEMSEEKFEKSCEQYYVFARLSPEMKYKIVKTLSLKYRVGFLGEGINDVPPLTVSLPAIVVESGADVSKKIADLILLERDLKVIILGIAEGRRIYANIQKYLKVTLSSNIGNFYSMGLISLFVPFLPILPVQVLLMDLLSDFPLVFISTDEIEYNELKKPAHYTLGKVFSLILSLGFVAAIFNFLFFLFFRKFPLNLLRTTWFMGSTLIEILLIFSLRTRGPFWKTKFPSLPLFFFSLLTVFLIFYLPFSSLGQSFFSFAQPPSHSLILITILALLYFTISESIKIFYYKKFQF